jgi:hypothetical protein
MNEVGICVLQQENKNHLKFIIGLSVPIVWSAY